MPIDPANAGPLHAMAAALRARLEQFFPPARFAHGLVPANLTPQAWQQLTRRAPFVGLGFQGIKPVPTSGRVLQGVAHWAVFLVARHERIEARHLGDRTTPGLFGMVSVAGLVLHGHTLRDAAGGAIGSIGVTGVQHATAEGLAANDDALAVLTLDLPLPAPGDALLDGLDDFLRLGATWTFDPAAPGDFDLHEVRS